jgi:hypothetical protein
MPNYNETNVTGTKWTRSNQVRIRNPLDGIPTATFMEEEVVNLDNGERITQRASGVSERLIDPSVSFNLLNPEDDSVIGTMTYGQVYAALYSLYRKLAAERDAQSNDQEV